MYDTLISDVIILIAVVGVSTD